MNSNQVTLVGSGIVGCSWAIIFAKAKFNVRIFDLDQSKIATLLDSAKQKLEMLDKYNLLQESVASILDRVVGFSDMSEALAHSFYVQECIPEVLELKLDLFAQLDQLAHPDAILASSSSNMPSSAFCQGLSVGRARCLVVHPINPPHLIPLVEIVPSEWTKAEVVASVRALMTLVGQKPVTLKREISGFIVNRLQYALMGECYRLVQEGVISPEDIDTTITAGLAMRWAFMGPFQTIDLNAPKGIEDYCNRYNGGIASVLQEEDNAVPFTPELIQRLTEHQRSLYDIEQIPRAVEWRDQKLLSLGRLKVEEANTIDKMFPAKK
jgi:3-hydroxyacyl-CoA dehydrogenase